MLLYPQLPHHTAAHLTEALRCRAVPDLAAQSAIEHPDAVFTPTGGTRVGTEKLKELRDVLTKQAAAHGYPLPASDEKRREFDVVASVALHSMMQISPAEAAKKGVWEFMTCIMAPDVVRWRFPGEGSGTAPERFLTGRRNTFQRLWWRAHVMRDDGRQDNPYALLALLGEDEIVQIMERPNLAGYRRLTAYVAAGLLTAVDRHKVVARRLLIREVQKHLLRLSSIVMFDALEEEQLQSLVLQLYDRVVAVAMNPGGADA